MLGVKKVRELVRPDISALQPYQADCVICGSKLDANENGWDVPGAIKEELFTRLRKLALNRYPDAAWSAVRKALAQQLQTQPQQFLIGNGSSELIMALMQIFTGPGVRVVYPSPSFVMYPVYATIAGAVPVKVTLNEDFSLDPEKVIAESHKPHTGLVMLCTPNNPTGNAMPLTDIEKIVANSPCVVAVDEAYYEFHGETAQPLVAKYANAVILRTFSKAYGLAGARVGYLFGQEEVVRQIAKVILPYNVNALSMTMAELALNRPEFFQPRIQAIIEERTRIATALRAIATLTVYPSQANFLLLKTPVPGSTVARQLQLAGIGVRDFGGELADTIRVSIGAPGENDAFLQGLRSILAEVG